MSQNGSGKQQRVALYLRVSKDDGSQETDNQLLQLRDFCERWEGHELVAEYVDRESGTRGRRERRDFDRMFADAARRRFDVLLFVLGARPLQPGGHSEDHCLPAAPRRLRGGVQVLHRAVPRYRQRADSPHRDRGQQLLRPVGGAADLRADEGRPGAGAGRREGRRPPGWVRALGPGASPDAGGRALPGGHEPGDRTLL